MINYLYNMGDMSEVERKERYFRYFEFGEDTEFLKIMHYIKNSSMFRHEMMKFYRGFILENDTLIRKDMQKYKEELPPGDWGNKEINC